MNPAKRFESLKISVGKCYKNIYHLLSGTFSQCVAIAQVVDFDVFDVVAVLLVNLGLELARALAGRRGVRFGDGTLRLHMSVSDGESRSVSQ